MSEPPVADGRAAASPYALATAALSPIAMPVVIVGAADGDRRSCATATVMYTSLVPPLVAIALHPGSKTLALVRATGELSISILGADQTEVAVRAGRSAPGLDKFASTDIEALAPPGGFGAPGVAGSVAVLWCRVTQLVETGDHVLVIARVDAHVRPGSTAAPLLRSSRRYAALGDRLSDADEKYPL